MTRVKPSLEIESLICRTVTVRIVWVEHINIKLERNRLVSIFNWPRIVISFAPMYKLVSAVTFDFCLHENMKINFMHAWTQLTSNKLTLFATSKYKRKFNHKRKSKEISSVFTIQFWKEATTPQKEKQFENARKLQKLAKWKPINKFYGRDWHTQSFNVEMIKLYEFHADFHYNFYATWKTVRKSDLGENLKWLQCPQSFCSVSFLQNFLKISFFAPICFPHIRALIFLL